MGCPPGMRGCPAGAMCGHKQIVEGYREERLRREIEAENVSLGYDTEYKEWVADHPLPTFKQWLVQSKRLPEMPKPVSEEADQPTETPVERAQPFRVGDRVWHHERQGMYEIVKLDPRHDALELKSPNRRDRFRAQTADVERRTWKEVDRPAEVAKAREQWAADREAEKRAEAAEMREYLAVDHEVPTLQQTRDYNETGLLGAAMASDSALPALRVVKDEFSDPFHENVARAILDQAADGAPHDAVSVEAVLRERKVFNLPELPPEPLDERPYGPYYPDIENADQPYQQFEMPPPETPSQLPGYMDPDKSLAPVDQVQYGLRAWERAAVPADANSLAQGIRQDYRARYLEQVGIKLAQNARGAAETGDDPGLELADAAHELVNIPPKLDANLQPTSNFISRDPVDTTKPVRVVTAPSEARATPDLGLPPKPVLTSMRVAASA